MERKDNRQEKKKTSSGFDEKSEDGERALASLDKQKRQNCMYHLQKVCKNNLDCLTNEETLRLNN